MRLLLLILLLAGTNIAFAHGPDTTRREVSRCFGDTPQFPGGTDSLMRFFLQHIHVTDTTLSAPVRSVIRFTVNENGTVSDAKIMRSISPAVDREMIRVALLLPRWEPARKNGVPVRSEYTWYMLLHVE